MALLEFGSVKSKMITNPSSKFMNAPAAKIIARQPIGAAFNVPCLSTSSSSPSMTQAPPIGKIHSLNIVSPICFEKIAGPIPIQNSRTRTPAFLAAIKCPNS